MKVIVAGGRDFKDKNLLCSALHRLLTDFEDSYWMPLPGIEIVSGAAKGADEMGADWAVVHCTGLKEFPANWDKYGKAAGILRNIEMAEYADVLVAFWDGKSRGTEHMIDVALKSGLEVHVYRYSNGE